ncbi:hypothetical protein LCGC14_2171120, partial [marine sediment metagenome]
VADLRAQLRSSEEAREGLREGIKAGLAWLDPKYSSARPGQHQVHEGEAIEALEAALSSPSTGCKTCNGARQINVKEGDPRHFKWVRKPCAACSPSTGLYEALKLARGALEFAKKTLSGAKVEAISKINAALAAIKDYEGGHA